MALPGFRGQLTAEQILGMKPEDLQAKLDAAVTKEDLSATQSKIEEQGTALSEIRAMLSKLTTPEPVVDPNVKLDADDPTTQVLTDPQGFINRQTAGIAATAAQARADVLEIRARQQHAGAFQKFGKEIMDSAKNFPVSVRADENFWNNHVAMVMGQKLVKGELEAGSYPSLVGSSSFAPSSGGSESDPNKGFDPDMAKFFKDRNVPLEQAAKIKKLMVENGEPINMENYKGVARA